MSALERADAFALWWVQRYTAALPADVARRRRDEIRSDVWEHRAWATQAGAAPVTLALSVVRRVVTGMVADLSWRRAQLATAHGMPSRPALTAWSWIRRTWWQALALLLGGMEFAGGAIAPFEQPPGDVRTVVVNTSAGLVVMAGLLVRRRRRSRGDLMIAAGVVPVVPLFWTYVLPIVAVTVIAAALIDAIDAFPSAAARGTRADQGRRVLVAALATATASAVVIGGADAAVVLVSPVLAALITHGVVRRHRQLATITRAGLLVLGTGLGCGVLTVLVVMVSTADELSMSTGAATVVAAVTATGAAVGATLLAIGARTATRPPGRS